MSAHKGQIKIKRERTEARSTEAYPGVAGADSKARTAKAGVGMSTLPFRSLLNKISASALVASK
jgi:hypothetical protein